MNKFKKFLGNKNTVTILGLIICVAILYIGYHFQISRATKLVDLPVATEDIQPRTLITDNLVKTVRVPSSFLEGSYYSYIGDIVGKYSNYNTIIAKGSLFYTSLLIDAKDMPNAIYSDVPDGHIVVSYPVSMETTYLNTMEPDTYIDIYFKGVNDEDKVMFGKFVRNVKILAVKNSSGQNVFEAVEESRTPAYIFFALPEGVFELLRKGQYIASDYGIEFTLVPNTIKLTEQDVVSVSSEQIRDFILDRTEFLDDTNIEVTDEEAITRVELEELKKEQQETNQETTE